MAVLLAHNRDPDQMQHSVASHLGLHCLPITFLGLMGKNLWHACWVKYSVDHILKYFSYFYL